MFKRMRIYTKDDEVRRMLEKNVELPTEVMLDLWG